MSISGTWAELALVGFTGVATGIILVLVSDYAARLRLVQTANARSSHVGQKPTGGGVAIAVAVLSVAFWLILFSDFPLFWVTMIGFLLALVGFQDDRGGLPVNLRLISQIVALSLALLLTPELAGALNPLPVWFATSLIVGAGVIWVNFYNFMDGIDGLAATQAVFLSVSVLVLALIGAGQPLSPVWLFTLCLTCASLVFLMVNWAPSRLFMGDGGVYFLSFILLFIALFGVQVGHYPLASALILPGVFVIDAGMTLLRRTLRGENWRTAHRTHAYQHLSRRFGHAQTVLIYLAINCAWLLVWALIVQAGAINPWAAVLIAYLPLVAFTAWAKAGRPENAR